MNEHIELETMHDLLDGLVRPSEEMRLRGHLRACAGCREEFAALEAAVTALRDLPDEARAPDGLWSGIESRIAQAATQTPGDSDKVLSLDSARRSPRRFSLTLPQLAAAAVVVSLVSAGTVWTALSRGNGGGPGIVPASASAVGSPSARVVSLGETGYDEAVVQLETIIEQGRHVLSPETLATLEASLRTIDGAIADVRGALEADPSSELLARLLANHQRSKLRVLRQAAISVQPRS